MVDSLMFWCLVGVEGLVYDKVFPCVYGMWCSGVAVTSLFACQFDLCRITVSVALVPAWNSCMCTLRITSEVNLCFGGSNKGNLVSVLKGDIVDPPFTMDQTIIIKKKVQQSYNGCSPLGWGVGTEIWYSHVVHFMLALLHPFHFSTE